jgi:ankyrin repeat protein
MKDFFVFYKSILYNKYMNNIQKHLFHFFKNWEHLSEGNKKDGLGFLQMYNCLERKILENKKFDINSQDELGNTLFHYVFKNNDYAYINLFLKNGANPFVYNKDNKNALTYSKEYCKDYSKKYIMPFWNKYDSWQLDDNFNEKTTGYHVEFKKSVFNFIISGHTEFTKVEECCKFLNENELNTNENLSKILIYSPKIYLRESINYFSSLKPNSQENMILLNTILEKYDREKQNADLLKSKDFLKFLNENEFRLNGKLLQKMCNLNFSATGSNEVNEQLIDKLMQMVVKNSPSLHEIYYPNRKMNGELYKVSYHERFSQDDFIKNIYLNYSLENKLEDHPVKKRIKI